MKIYRCLKCEKRKSHTCSYCKGEGSVSEMEQMIFNISPMAKPRMTQSDKWKQRDCVMRYRDFKDSLKIQALQKRFLVPNTFEIEFCIPLPKTFSKSKKSQLSGRPHQKKPDIDNLIKAFLDALLIDDSAVWQVSAKKTWCDGPGRIVVRF